VRGFPSLSPTVSLATRLPRASRRHSPLSSLESALTSKHRVLPGFGRSCPSASPLECALTRLRRVTPLECALTKNGGRGVVGLLTEGLKMLPWTNRPSAQPRRRARVGRGYVGYRGAR
jgi:hypothetical protein